MQEASKVKLTFQHDSEQDTIFVLITLALH